MNTDAGTGFMHESFHKDNPDNFTRSWFAWANTLFGELIVHLIDEGKLDLLNSIKAKNKSFISKVVKTRKLAYSLTNFRNRQSRFHENT